MILVIGATGQLGTVITNKLVAGGRSVRVLVRPSSLHCPRERLPVDRVIGDLRDGASVKRACAGIDTVIATASSIVPRKGDRFGEDERVGYQNLINACRHHGIRQIIYISAFSTPHEREIPEFQVKRAIENLIGASGIPFTIFRGAAFMDIYFATLGSALARLGCQRNTLERAFWLTRLFGKATCGLIERHGLALVPGDSRTRHAFIAIDDVAEFMVKAIDFAPAQNRTFDIGGPEALSWNEVTELYSELLGKPIRILPLPGALLKTLAALLKPFLPAGANLVALLRLLGTVEHTPNTRPLAEAFGITLTSARTFLEQKLALYRSQSILAREKTHSL